MCTELRYKSHYCGTDTDIGRDSDKLKREHDYFTAISLPVVQTTRKLIQQTSTQCFPCSKTSVSFYRLRRLACDSVTKQHTHKRPTSAGINRFLRLLGFSENTVRALESVGDTAAAFGRRAFETSGVNIFGSVLSTRLRAFEFMTLWNNLEFSLT